ncbi:DinB-like domain protein [Gemmatirosa kalamazoonensis]|uniref:DinB-like domain protein n=1 Tax=Gemmatirosa kalamazoonensis TaxID=861299 RepID=W0RE62_9BACT|nr:bacillithiol transferase BstA [Gemmatirosa kalamazoonensis]AHG89101.1 DinB-like domain protein [Gemmatirosa kalamazoonensis]
MTTDLRYPIGRFTPPDAATATAATYARLIDEIERAPRELRAALEGLTDAQLDTPYRDGGWTVRQVAHHVPDSHLNAYVRFKLALTEDEPRIKPYEEAQWAELRDSRLPIAPSLALLDALHVRWVTVLRAIPVEDFERRAYDHPETGRVPLRAALGLYAWHGRHHTAHILGLRERMGW